MKKMAKKNITVRSKWNEIKSDIKKVWADLSENEIEKTKGDITQIRKLIQKKYGDVKEDYTEKINHIFSRINKQTQPIEAKRKIKK